VIPPKKPKRLPEKAGRHIKPSFERETTDRNYAVFSFAHFDATAECPSSWKKDIRWLFATFRKVSQMTWEQIRKTGGGDKTGLAYTPYKVPPFSVNWLTGDDTVTSMRITQKARIFGVRRREVYFVIRLDRKHVVSRQP